MTHSSLHLNYSEAEKVAAEIERVWQGITGLREAPKSEQLADLVQFTLRKAREAIGARPEEEAAHC